MPRYGTINNDDLASWFTRDDPGGPMWALNLMKYRERADYTDGRETAPTGAEGDGTRWDRIAIAQYRDRRALVEMNSSADFAEAESHKDAGMDFTIVMATFPTDGQPTPPQVSGADGDDRTFAEARYDLIAPAVADELAARDHVHDDTGYVVIADPVMDDVARSLTDPTQVLF